MAKTPQPPRKSASTEDHKDPQEPSAEELRARIDDLTKAEAKQRAGIIELQRQHRNMFAVMRTVVRRTADTCDSVEECWTNLDGRLDALMRCQSMLMHSPQGVDLGYLAAEQLAAYQTHEDGHLKLSGPDVRLQPWAVSNIGLALHELATNAVKHGALSSREGHIDIEWRLAGVDTDPRLIFCWIERGGPSPPEKPLRRGFGAELLKRSLDFELSADVAMNFDPAGLRCEINMPYTQRVFVDA